MTKNNGLKLYNYFRSSASYRVRIGLYYKELPFEYKPIHLVKDGGQQYRSDFLQINPMGHVPALDDGGFLVAESMAILQYLDAISPEKPLFPAEPRARAKVVQICEVINSGIQPLQNLKVMKELEQSFGLTKEDSSRFVKHWIFDGLSKLEKIVEGTAGSFCFGGDFTAAECFLVPQCFASRRFGVDVEQFPNLSRANTNALKLAAVMKAHPEKQPDYQA
jgi:maleylacetoacetate isomerase